jgi:hypothetical protein
MVSPTEAPKFAGETMEATEAKATKARGKLDDSKDALAKRLDCHLVLRLDDPKGADDKLVGPVRTAGNAGTVVTVKRKSRGEEQGENRRVRLKLRRLST